MKIRLAADIQTDSIVDGLGIRAVIWTQGCSHNCAYCHNPSTHDFNGGDLVEVDYILKEIENLKGQDGITFSGGDPMFQPKQCAEIAKKAHDVGLDVWAYTGFTFEELLEKGSNDILEFLKQIDVLIDGKFEIAKRSLDLEFRGSSNQRIIDVKKSLKNKKVVIFKLKQKKEVKKKKDKVYI